MMDDALYDLYTKHKIDRDMALSYAQDAATMQKRMY